MQLMLRGRCLFAGPAKGAESWWGAFLVELVPQCTHSRLDKQATTWTTVDTETGKCRNATKLLWGPAVRTHQSTRLGEDCFPCGRNKKKHHMQQVRTSPKQT